MDNYLTSVNSGLLMDVASAIGADRIADFVEGRPLFTQSERVHRLEVDETCEWLYEIALPSNDNVEDEQRALAAQIQLGDVFPVLQLAVRNASSDRVKESMVSLLDAALEAHRELGSFISRPGEFTRSRAHECLQEFLGLCGMAQALVSDSVPHQEGPDVHGDDSSFDLDVGPEGDRT